MAASLSLVINACFDIVIESWSLFTCTHATRILAVASIRLFHSAHPELWRQFKNGD